MYLQTSAAPIPAAKQSKVDQAMAAARRNPPVPFQAVIRQADIPGAELQQAAIHRVEIQQAGMRHHPMHQSQPAKET